MEKYKQTYGELPHKTPADTGYGSYDNYSYCKENGIELYMKYSGYYKEREKATQKNQYKLIHFKRDEKNQFVCPAGHTFELDKETIDTRGIYPKKNRMLVNHHCQDCPMRSQCTKSKTGRTISYCEELDKFHEEVKRNVQSEEGIQLMYQRSNETEGTFGDLKANQKYDRIRRRGESGVRLEIYLVCIGHNLRKYHRLKMKSEKQVKGMLNIIN